MRKLTKTSETSAVVRENSELSAMTEQNGDGVNRHSSDMVERMARILRKDEDDRA